MYCRAVIKFSAILAGSLASFFLLSLAGSPALAKEAPRNIPGATTVNHEGVVEAITSLPKLVVIDSRRKSDFDSGHIEGAINILDTNMTDENALASVVKTKSTPVLFYCNGLSCGRAANATKKAVQWGYTKVFYYAEGLHEWKRESLPLETLQTR